MVSENVLFKSGVSPLVKECINSNKRIKNVIFLYILFSNKKNSVTIKTRTTQIENSIFLIGTAFIGNKKIKVRNVTPHKRIYNL